MGVVDRERGRLVLEIRRGKERRRQGNKKKKRKSQVAIPNSAISGGSENVPDARRIERFYKFIYALIYLILRKHPSLPNPSGETIAIAGGLKRKTKYLQNPPSTHDRYVQNPEKTSFELFFLIERGGMRKSLRLRVLRDLLGGVKLNKSLEPGGARTREQMSRGGAVSLELRTGGVRA